MPDFRFIVNAPVSPEQFTDLLLRSTLSQRRPVHDPNCIGKMLKNANLTITAWKEDVLVGIARSLTDFGFCCYLSDLAVDIQFQSRGIGKELVRRTALQLDPMCKVILLAAPKATGYYPKIGFRKHDSAYISECRDLLYRHDQQNVR
ncbi:MAG: GNAT family N-acetyltransferase [Chitinispirillaceae bacterium]